MKITALLDALNSALAEPFALAWVSNSPRFLLVFTVIYAVAVIVAVTDQKNTRPGAEHGSTGLGGDGEDHGLAVNRGHPDLGCRRKARHGLGAGTSQPDMPDAQRFETTRQIV